MSNTSTNAERERGEESADPAWVEALRAQEKLTVTVSKKVAPIPVASFAEASRVVQEYIAKRSLGSGAWYRALPFTATSKGAAIHKDGVQVAFVSYNGRVWEGVEDMKLGHKELF